MNYKTYHIATSIWCSKLTTMLTQHEKEFIIANAATMTRREMAKELNTYPQRLNRFIAYNGIEVKKYDRTQPTGPRLKKQFDIYNFKGDELFI